MQTHETEVLIVGAGPVGMLTALLLAKGGVRVDIIDQDNRATTRSYACALHPQSLKILDRVGLASAITQLGRRVERIAFYDGPSRCAEIRLGGLLTEFPFVVTLPQSTVEGLLEQRLAADGGVRVRWNHRLSHLEPGSQDVAATIAELFETAKGYIVPTWEWEVKRTTEIRARYVVGADGCHSLVRRLLGIEYQEAGKSESFSMYEMDCAGDCPDEARVVLDDTTSNVLWPLPGRECRWTFELAGPGAADEFRSKERSPSVLIHRPGRDREWDDLSQLIRSRAPWFESQITELDWATTVTFDRRLAETFGRQRCWLAGDAAHQTGPIAMQSMNVGFNEAEQLADILVRMIRSRASSAALADFNTGTRHEWRRLFGLEGDLILNRQASEWAKHRAGRLLACIPASGKNLDRLLSQLDLEPVSAE